MLAITGDQSDCFQQQTGISSCDQEVLAQVPLLSGLPPNSFRALLANAWVQPFACHVILFLQDDLAAQFCVILNGWAKLFCTTEEGDKSVIAVFSHGESFTEAAIINQGIHPVSAEVVANSPARFAT